MSQTSNVTTDHGEIQRWVEERGGHPARVKGTEKRGSNAGVLRIDYPGFSGEDRLEEISWDEFFEGFEKNNLAFLYQDKTKDGEQSRFSKLVDRDKATEH
jgi:anaerobic selenocysteine-containing dehydrogenase